MFNNDYSCTRRFRVVRLVSLLSCLAAVSPEQGDQRTAAVRFYGGNTAGLHSGARRLLQQGQSTCSLDSLLPKGDPLWYTFVDSQPTYQGLVNASTPVTLRCATNSSATLQATCNASTRQWDNSTFPPCLDCRLPPPEVREIEEGVTNVRVRSLEIGDSVRIVVNTSTDCLPTTTISHSQAEDLSFAFTIMADSLEDRWITASTCGMTSDREFDSVLRVRQGCNATGLVLQQNDDFCGPTQQQSQVAFLAKAGQVYTIFLGQVSHICFNYPNITISATSGSVPELSKQTFLISPVQSPDLCWTSWGQANQTTLQPCGVNKLEQYIQLKDVGNGKVFLRPTHYDSSTVLAVDSSTGKVRLFSVLEPGANASNPYEEPVASRKVGEPLPKYYPPNEDRQFLVESLPSGDYQIHHPASKTCVDWQEGDLTLSPCAVDVLSQRFNLTKPAGTTPPDTLGKVVQVAAVIASTWCWQAPQPASASLILATCNSSNQYQMFLITDAGGGFMYLAEQGSGQQRVVELPDGQRDDDIRLQFGDRVPGALNQMWSLMDLGGGAFRFVSALTSLCSTILNPELTVVRQDVCGSQDLVVRSQSFRLQSLPVPSLPPPPWSPPIVPGPHTFPPPRIPSGPNQQPPQPPAYLPPSQTEGTTCTNCTASLKPGAVAGILIGGLAFVLLVCGLLGAWYMVRQKRTKSKAVADAAALKATELDPKHPDSEEPLSKDPLSNDNRATKDLERDTGAAVRQKLHVKGLVKGEPFLRGAAPHFTWSDLVPGPACQAVEEGVNAEQLDKLAGAGIGAGWPGSGSPVIRLSGVEFAQQVELLKQGLLGRGATALVFKCCWPNRFGPNALLACKVLRDPFDGDLSEHVQAFRYEAKVLEDLRHPNIVRLYGYCLEAPTVCLIMELLPSSLKKRLTLSSTTLPSTTGLSAQENNSPVQTAMEGTQVLVGTSPLASVALLAPSSNHTPSTSTSHGLSNGSSGIKTAADVTINVADTTTAAKQHTADGIWASGTGLRTCLDGQDKDVMPGTEAQGPAAATTPTTKTQSDSEALVRHSKSRPVSPAMSGGQASGKPPLPCHHLTPALRAQSPMLLGLSKPPVLPAPATVPSTTSSIHSDELTCTPSFNLTMSVPTSTSSLPEAKPQPASRTISPLAAVPLTLGTLDVALGHSTPSASAAGPSTSHTPVTGHTGPSTSRTSVTGHSASPWAAIGGPAGSGPYTGPLASPLPSQASQGAATLPSQASQGAGSTRHSSCIVTDSTTACINAGLVTGPVQTAPRLTMLEVLRMSTDIACGLAYLHQRPAPELTSTPSVASSVTQSASGSMGDGRRMIVHRDLKPDNVLVNSLGVAKICDFGLARVHDSTTIYSVHLAVGTLRYMAPELLDGEINKPMTDRVDLYSLGMLMWEMVTGEPPWKGLTDPQIMTAVQLKKRPAMSSSSAAAAPPPPRTPSPFPRSQEDASRMTLYEEQASVFSDDLVPSRSEGPARPCQPVPAARSSQSGTIPSLDIERSSAPARQYGSSFIPRLGHALSGTSAAMRTSAPGMASPIQGALSTLNHPASGLAADTAASFDAVPQFKTLVSACWQHNSIRRPTAHAVHKQLATLLRRYQPQQTLQQPQASEGRVSMTAAAQASTRQECANLSDSDMSAPTTVGR